MHDETSTGSGVTSFRLFINVNIKVNELNVEIDSFKMATAFLT